MSSNRHSCLVTDHFLFDGGWHSPTQWKWCTILFPSVKSTSCEPLTLIGSDRSTYGSAACFGHLEAVKMHQKWNKIKNKRVKKVSQRDLTIITNEKSFSFFMYLSIYLFTYLLLRVTVKYSILAQFFIFSCIFLLYFCMHLAIFFLVFLFILVVLLALSFF